MVGRFTVFPTENSPFVRLLYVGFGGVHSYWAMSYIYHIRYPFSDLETEVVVLRCFSSSRTPEFSIESGYLGAKWSMLLGGCGPKGHQRWIELGNDIPPQSISILPRFDLGWLVTCNPLALDIIGETTSFAFVQGLIFTWHIHVTILSLSLMTLCVDF